jgi:hypothetical protein
MVQVSCYVTMDFTEKHFSSMEFDETLRKADLTRDQMINLLVDITELEREYIRKFAGTVYLVTCAE